MKKLRERIELTVKAFSKGHFTVAETCSWLYAHAKSAMWDWAWNGFVIGFIFGLMLMKLFK